MAHYRQHKKKCVANEYTEIETEKEMKTFFTMRYIDFSSKRNGRIFRGRNEKTNTSTRRPNQYIVRHTDFEMWKNFKINRNRHWSVVRSHRLYVRSIARVCMCVYLSKCVRVRFPFNVRIRRLEVWTKDCECIAKN